MDHIQDYFDYILKNHGEKTGYYLELLTFETIKLLGRTKSKIAKDKNGENVPYWESTEVVIIRCNVVNNSYQQNSTVLYTFLPNKLFSQLLDISHMVMYISMVYLSNSNLLKIKDKINITLVIN